MKIEKEKLYRQFKLLLPRAYNFKTRGSFCERCGSLIGALVYEKKDTYGYNTKFLKKQQLQEIKYYKRMGFIYTGKSKTEYAKEYRGFYLCNYCYEQKQDNIRSKPDIEDLYDNQLVDLIIKFYNRM